MIDRELIIRKLALILKDLSELRELAAASVEEYLSDSKLQAATERYLERMIGRMIDVNYHLVTESGHPPPRDYFESFISLGGLGVLPHDFAKDIASAAGLRNRIAHEYDDLDPKKVHDALQLAMRQIPIYLRE